MERVAVPVVQGGQPQPFLSANAPIQMNPEAVAGLQDKIIQGLMSGAISPKEAQLIAQEALYKEERDKEKALIQARVLNQANTRSQQYG